MNNELIKKGFVWKFLISMCIIGISFSFAANGNIGDAAVQGFFNFVQEYLIYIVIGVVLFAAAGMLWNGVEWKFVLIMTVVVISIWVIGSDKTLITKAVNGTKSFVGTVF